MPLGFTTEAVDRFREAVEVPYLVPYFDSDATTGDFESMAGCYLRTLSDTPGKNRFEVQEPFFCSALKVRDEIPDSLPAEALKPGDTLAKLQLCTVKEKQLKVTWSDRAYALGTEYPSHLMPKELGRFWLELKRVKVLSIGSLSSKLIRQMTGAPEISVERYMSHRFPELTTLPKHVAIAYFKAHRISGPTNTST